MKSAVLTGLNTFEFLEKEQPRIKEETDVLIRMERVGVCGSDIHYFTEGGIGNAKVDYPFSVGHEGAGTVIETGSGVASVKSGDRIAIDPAMSCFSCDQCNAGRPHTCRNLKFLGCPGEAEGCLSEFIVMPEKSCFPIPDSMSFDQAVISEPLAIGVYGVKRSGFKAGNRTGIFGAGPVGLSVLVALRYRKAGPIYVSEKIAERRETALRAGAVWAGNPQTENISQRIKERAPEGLDVVFECCGEQEAIRDGIEALRPGGTLVIIGIPSIDTVIFNPHMIRRKEIDILNIRRQNGCVQETLDMIAEKKVDVDFMITHTFPFKRVGDAFTLVAGYEDGVIKAMIDMRT